MSEVNLYNTNSIPPPNSFGKNDEVSSYMNLEAHTSTNMKVKRPKVTPNDLTIILPVKKPFSDQEATKRMQAINTDIYESATKEKEKHEFNLKRYFTICGIIALITAAITYLRKGK